MFVMSANNSKGKATGKPNNAKTTLPAVTSPAKATVAPKTNNTKTTAASPIKSAVKSDKLPPIANNSTSKPPNSADDTNVSPSVASKQGITAISETADPAPSSSDAIAAVAVTVSSAEEVPVEPIVPVASEPLPEPVAVVVVEPVKNNGKVQLLYEQYDEDFPIKDGSITQAEIDDVYCLSFVMPDCLLHLSRRAPADHRQRLAEHLLDDLFLDEQPAGTYHGLVDDERYYVYVEQAADQLAREALIRAQQKKEGRGLAADSQADGLKKQDGRGPLESCSCVYGNPCVDEYGCKDWNNRFAIATKNGWKGF